MQGEITDPLETALAEELMRGERVLWKGRGAHGLRLGHFAIWLFAIPWTAFAVFWTLMAGLFTLLASDRMEPGIDLIFPLFGLPFILVGLGMMAVPFLGPRRARRTIFAITDQRILKIYRSRRLEVESIPAGKIGVMERNEGRDGKGTLKIAFDAANDEGSATRHFVLGEVAGIRMAEMRVRELAERARRVSSSASTRT